MNETSQLLNYLNQQVQMGKLGFSESDTTGDSIDKTALLSQTMQLLSGEEGSFASDVIPQLVLLALVALVVAGVAISGFVGSIDLATIDTSPQKPAYLQNYNQFKQDELQPVYPTNTPQPMHTQAPVFQQPAASQPSSSGGNSCRGLQPRVPIDVVIDCGRLPWDIGNVPACDGVSTASIQTQTCAVAGSTGIDISTIVFGTDSHYCLSAANKAVQSCGQ